MIRDIYKTADGDATETGMAVTLGKHDETGIFGLGVHNLIEGVNAFAILDRDELLRLRDAITLELAS